MYGCQSTIVDSSRSIILSSLPHANLERDNFGVSWLVLRGNADLFQSDLGALLVIELTCGGLFAASQSRWLHWECTALLIFVAGLLALASIDLERLILPRASSTRPWSYWVLPWCSTPVSATNGIGF